MPLLGTREASHVIDAPTAEWDTIVRRSKTEAPEAFLPDGHLLNLIEGERQEPGFGRRYTSAVDGRSLGRISMIDLEAARRAVKYARSEANPTVELDERRRRVAACLAGVYCGPGRQIPKSSFLCSLSGPVGITHGG